MHDCWLRTLAAPSGEVRTSKNPPLEIRVAPGLMQSPGPDDLNKGMPVVNLKSGHYKAADALGGISQDLEPSSARRDHGADMPVVNAHRT